MPTTYAHDLFGQKVYRQLPENMKKIIRENGELYRIGLHGPDIFFYYFIFKNHVSGVGYRMHKEKAAAFFQEGMAQDKREEGARLFWRIFWFWMSLSSGFRLPPFCKRDA